ncbi:uncharacterized protein LOC127732051 [Mytilus californianus]|uniref:uncharacterized protein LOC127732051 n=1 Tax=Mytilus californianus TaxID=6549 RepID=UPI0022476AB1|nr:uncharacterized protein LOC127732051 [Mytilus californianus]
MDIHRIFVSVYLVVLSCDQATTDISEIKDIADWEEAVSVCFNRGCVLESNLTVLSKYLQQNNNVQSLWSGSYIAMLPWMEILGCFRIKWMYSVEEITFAKSMIEVNSAVCQLKCSHARYFAVNSDTSRCVCFDDQGLVNSPSLSADECLKRCLINNTDCFELVFTYKILNETDLQLDIPTDTLKSCVYSDCISSQQRYEKDYCSKPYIALCRDGQNAVHSTEYASYDGLLWGCLYQKDTFPLLFSADICDLDQSSTQHWIGVRSQTLHIHYMDQYDVTFETVKDRIVKCGHYNRSGINFGNCSIQNHFICKTGSFETTEVFTTLTSIGTTHLQNGLTEVTDGSNTSNFTVTTGLQNATLERQKKEDSTSISAYTIMLAVVMVILVIGISAMTIFVLMRKFHTKNGSESRESRLSNLKHNSTKITMHANSNYTDIDIIRQDSFAQEVVNTRYIDSANSTNGDSILSREIFEKDGKPNRDYQIVRKHFNNKETNTNTVSPREMNSQSLIKTVLTIKPSQDSLVTSTKSGEAVNIFTKNPDYDHLNDFKEDTISEGKVYDHVMTVVDSDPTYDHFKTNTKPKDDNYDHVSVK